MRGRWLFVVAIIGLLALNAVAQSESAGSAQLPDKGILQNRVDQLEQLVTRLQQRIDELEQKSVSNKPEEKLANSSPEERYDTLDQKLRIIERNRELAQEDATAKAKEAPVVSASRDGFSIGSADKSYRLKFGGYAQADGKTFYDDAAHSLTDSFGVRRARLNIDGTVGKYIDFRIAPEFGNGSVSLYDAYADLKYQPYAVLRGGKFKTPLGLELLQTDTDMTFIERSLVSDLVPNRDAGFQIYGDFAGRVSYQAAVVNGTLDGANSDVDTNDGKDVVGRVFATPFAKSGPQFLQGFGFGIGVSSGRQNGASLPSFKTTGGQATFFSYGSGSGATAVTIAAGNRLRYSPQLYYYNGPFGLVAEYVESGQDISAVVNKATVLHDIANHAWQVAGSWLITGERKSYGRLTPSKGLENSNSGHGFGAWELAARYTELNVDPAAFALKFADITKSAEAARTWSTGVNWYLNKNARLSFDYEQTHFQGGALTGNRPTEKAFEQRLQVVF